MVLPDPARARIEASQQFREGCVFSPAIPCGLDRRQGVAMFQDESDPATIPRASRGRCVPPNVSSWRSVPLTSTFTDLPVLEDTA